MSVFTKDPHAVLDYTVDWTAWLGVDLIVDSEWEVPTGITSDSEEQTGTTTTIWLSGGTMRQNYKLTNRITTATGRVEDRTILIQMTEH